MTSRTLNAIEAQVIRNELNSPALRWLNDDDLYIELVGLFQKIKMLTGAILYAPAEGLAEQVLILQMFLISHPKFNTLTITEIFHAFILNSQGEYNETFRHFNKPMNAEFFGDVLLAYDKYKQAIYKRNGAEIKAIMSPPEIKVIVHPTEEQLRWVIQADYELFIDGKPEFIFMTQYAYALLRQYGGIQIYSRQYWHKLIGRAMNERERYGNAPLFKKDQWEKENIRKVNQIYVTYHQKGWIPRDEYAMIIHTVRKRLYFRFLKAMQYFNIKDIFTEINCTKNEPRLRNPLDNGNNKRHSPISKCV